MGGNVSINQSFYSINQTVNITNNITFFVWNGTNITNNISNNFTFINNYYNNITNNFSSNISLPISFHNVSNLGGMLKISCIIDWNGSGDFTNLNDAYDGGCYNVFLKNHFDSNGSRVCYKLTRDAVDKSPNFSFSIVGESKAGVCIDSDGYYFGHEGNMVIWNNGDSGGGLNLTRGSKIVVADGSEFSNKHTKLSYSDPNNFTTETLDFVALGVKAGMWLRLGGTMSAYVVQIASVDSSTQLTLTEPSLFDIVDEKSYGISDAYLDPVIKDVSFTTSDSMGAESFIGTATLQPLSNQIVGDGTNFLSSGIVAGTKLFTPYYTITVQSVDSDTQITTVETEPWGIYVSVNNVFTNNPSERLGYNIDTQVLEWGNENFDETPMVNLRMDNVDFFGYDHSSIYNGIGKDWLFTHVNCMKYGGGGATFPYLPTHSRIENSVALGGLYLYPQMYVSNTDIGGYLSFACDGGFSSGCDTTVTGSRFVDFIPNPDESGNDGVSLVGNFKIDGTPIPDKTNLGGIILKGNLRYKTSVESSSRVLDIKDSVILGDATSGNVSFVLPNIYNSNMSVGYVNNLLGTTYEFYKYDSSNNVIRILSPRVIGDVAYSNFNDLHASGVFTGSSSTYFSLVIDNTTSVVNPPTWYYRNGVDDISSGGSYSGSSYESFIIAIDSVSPDNGQSYDTFIWSSDGGSTWSSSIPITTGEQLLKDGVFVQFGGFTGHGLGDYAVIVATRSDSFAWSIDGGSSWNYGNVISGSPQYLTDGISVSFDNVVGHSVGDVYNFWVTIVGTINGGTEVDLSKQYEYGKFISDRANWITENDSVNGEDTVWNIVGSSYLFNNSGVLDVNETKLNETISGFITPFISDLQNWNVSTNSKIDVLNSSIINETQQRIGNDSDLQSQINSKANSADLSSYNNNGVVYPSTFTIYEGGSNSDGYIKLSGGQNAVASQSGYVWIIGNKNGLNSANGSIIFGSGNIPNSKIDMRLGNDLSDSFVVRVGANTPILSVNPVSTTMGNVSVNGNISANNLFANINASYVQNAPWMNQTDFGAYATLPVNMSNVTLPSNRVIGTNTLAQNILTQEDLFWSAGIISGGNVSKNPDGTINISGGEARIREYLHTCKEAQCYSPLYSIQLQAINNVNLTEGINYCYFDYNGGNPIQNCTTDKSSINCEVRCYNGIAVRENTTVWFKDAKYMNIDFNTKDRVQKQNNYNGNGNFRCASGKGILSASGLYVSLTSDTCAFGLNLDTFLDFDTSVAGSGNQNVFDYYYRNGSGGWIKVLNQKTLDTSNYDTNTGVLTPVTLTYYSVQDVYVIIDSSSPRLVIVYGQNQYSLLTDAEQAPLPSLPPVLQGLGFHVGRFVVLSGASSVAQTYGWEGQTYSNSAGVDGNNYPLTVSFSNDILTITRNGLADITTTINLTNITNRMNIINATVYNNNVSLQSEISLRGSQDTALQSNISVVNSTVYANNVSLQNEVSLRISQVSTLSSNVSGINGSLSNYYLLSNPYGFLNLSNLTSYVTQTYANATYLFASYNDTIVRNGTIFCQGGYIPTNITINSTGIYGACVQDMTGVSSGSDSDGGWGNVSSITYTNNSVSIKHSSVCDDALCVNGSYSAYDTVTGTEDMLLNPSTNVYWFNGVINASSINASINASYVQNAPWTTQAYVNSTFFMNNYVPPYSMVLTTGVYNGTTGNIANLSNCSDNRFVLINESSSTPAYNFSVVFNVSSFDKVMTRAYYLGTTTHWITINIVNCTGSLYQLDTIENTGSYHTFEDGLGYGMNMSKFICNGTNPVATGQFGNVTIRYIHPQAGTVTHQFPIDCVNLVQ